MDAIKSAFFDEGDSRKALDLLCRAVEDHHDCDQNAVPYESDGPLGHGWECGVCGKFLQAG